MWGFPDQKPYLEEVAQFALLGGKTTPETSLFTGPSSGAWRILVEL